MTVNMKKHLKLGWALSAGICMAFAMMLAVPLQGAAAASAGPQPVPLSADNRRALEPFAVGAHYLRSVDQLETKYQCLVAADLSPEEKIQQFEDTISPILALQCKQNMRRINKRIPRACVEAFLSKKIEELGMQGCWDFVTHDLRMPQHRQGSTALVQECWQLYDDMYKFYHEYLPSFDETFNLNTSLEDTSIRRLGESYPSPTTYDSDSFYACLSADAGLLRHGKSVWKAYQSDIQQASQLRLAGHEEDRVASDLQLLKALISPAVKEYMRFRLKLGLCRRDEPFVLPDSCALAENQKQSELLQQVRKYAESLPAGDLFCDIKKLYIRSNRILYRMTQCLRGQTRLPVSDEKRVFSSLRPMATEVFIPSPACTNWRYFFDGTKPYGWYVERIMCAFMQQGKFRQPRYSVHEIRAARDCIASIVDGRLDREQKDVQEQRDLDDAKQNLLEWLRDLPKEDIPKIEENQINDEGEFFDDSESLGQEEAIIPAIAPVIQVKAHEVVKR